MNKNNDQGPKKSSHEPLNQQSSRQKKKGPGLLLIGVGTILTSMVVAGFLLGYAMDVWLETQPIFLLSFGLLGLIGGILKAYKLLTDPELY